MTPSIGLFANQGSEQLSAIADAVARRGGRPITCDLRIGGEAGQAGPRVTFGDGAGAGSWGGVDFEDIHALHIRCLTPRVLPVLPPRLDELSFAELRLTYVREQYLQAATHAFFEFQHARGALVVNRPAAFRDHDTKSQFYEKLRTAGFRVPRSLTTSDPAAAASFLESVEEAVAKPAIGVGSTRLVGAEDRARLDTVARCPTLFQERIYGTVLRLHVVGRTLVTALAVHGEGIDSRTGKQSFETVVVSPDECARLVAATAFLGLHYAAWDAIRTADGRLVYLDCNPGPFVLWLPEENRLAVFDRLAAYLIAFARARRHDPTAPTEVLAAAAARGVVPLPPQPATEPVE